MINVDSLHLGRFVHVSIKLPVAPHWLCITREGQGMNIVKRGRAMWPKAQFAYRGDPRFSYCMHLPASAHSVGSKPRLLVAMHGSGRGCMAYRDALIPFAEANNVVVLAPLFPVGVLGDDNADGYKYIAEGELRYDHILLGMVDEISEIVGCPFDLFHLFGFSGGGHFAHRFYYLHPDRLASVTVGAPGGVTLLDNTRDFWIGTRDFAARFGTSPNLDAMRRVPSQLLVGAEDTQEFVYPPAVAHHAADMESLGKNRLQRNETLFRNWLDHGLPSERSVLPGIAHEGLRVIPAVEDFLARTISTTGS
ncbi:alpha/beta fold hydrolase [Sphingobium sp. SCG-1]|uniref:alpha/beta fold hydrolase n=1 Tax=Sphingobium sp. SCG-1 TaxID=2072936 RepID=UPI00166F8063|nr:alpha/beta hydrolase [Sphingobium sp. SCG-1]